jgi:hypothetical protein
VGDQRHGLRSVALMIVARGERVSEAGRDSVGSAVTLTGTVSAPPAAAARERPDRGDTGSEGPPHQVPPRSRRWRLPANRATVSRPPPIG